MGCTDLISTNSTALKMAAKLDDMSYYASIIYDQISVSHCGGKIYYTYLKLW
jgi:hypothetical protein